jgi:putative ABC transport system substrate-binding protein
MHRKKWSLIVVIIIIAAASAFYFITNNPPEPETRSVVAVFPILVDAFNQFHTEAGKVLNERNVTLDVLSAEGDPSRFATVIEAALLKKPDLLVLVGTQLTNIGLSPKYESSIPLTISSCISHPQNVERLVEIGLEPKRSKEVAILSDSPRQSIYSYGASLVKNVLPELKTAAVLFNNSEINSKATANGIANGLREQKIEVLEGIVTSSDDVIKVAQSMILKGAKLLIIPHDKYVIQKAGTVVKVATEAGIPVFSLDDGTVKSDGATFGVSINYGELGKLTAELALEILNGKAPSEIPLAQQDKAKAYFNKNSWKQLNLPAIFSEIEANATFF